MRLNTRHSLLLPLVACLLPWMASAGHADDPPQDRVGHAHPPGRLFSWTPLKTPAEPKPDVVPTAAEDPFSGAAFGNWVEQFEARPENPVRQAVQETQPLMPVEPAPPGFAQPSPQTAEAQRLIGRRTLGTTFAARSRRQLLARSAPPAIGDFFGGARTSSVTVPAFSSSGGPSLNRQTEIPNPTRPGTNVGRIKFAENGSAIPRDRMYISHSYFDDVPLGPNGISVNRFAPGFEKTFLDGMMSAEFRIPFATTLSSDVLADGTTNTDDVEFGNLLATLKAMAFTTETFALAAGMQVALPTANDLTVRDENGIELLSVENEAVHLMPFVASLYTPNDQWFLQSFLQLDVDANGNPLLINDGTTAFANTDAGRLDDKTYLFADVSVGYWLFRSDATYDRLTGIAPMVELHYSRSLEGSSDSINVQNRQGNRYIVGDSTNQFDLLNFTAGLTFEFNKTSNLTVGYTTPLGGGSDRDFNGEFRVFYTHRFGPPQHRNFIY